MDKQPFKAAPFFLERICYWPLEKYEQLINETSWPEGLFTWFESDPLLREAILIASSSLYQAIDRNHSRSEQSALSLLSYMIRMGTRPTPFGLFAFVGFGKWEETSATSFKPDQIGKKVRPDMGWFYHEIEKDYLGDNLSLQPIKVNPLMIKRGGICFLNYSRNDEGKPQESSLILTDLTQLIFEKTESPITVEALFLEIQKIYPSAEYKKVEGVIRQLLKEEFLLFARLPSLLTDNPLNFLECLESCSLLSPLQQYEELPPGKGEEALLSLHKLMEPPATDKPPLQVDTHLKSQTIALSPLVKEELEKVVNVYWTLTSYLEPQERLSKYRQAFIEKYGRQRTVPLLELLCPHKGLGSHETYPMAPPRYKSYQDTFEEWLAVEWQQCLKEKKKEILLTEEKLDQLFKKARLEKPDPENAFLSFDAFCKISAPSEIALDQGDFLLYFSQFNWEGGSTFGRFFTLLDPQNQEEVKEFFLREEGLEKGTLFFELSYWPPTIRTANMGIQPRLRGLKLDLEDPRKEEGSLKLDDIFVGVVNERFYLTLKEGGSELIPRFGNFINPSFAPLPFKFIREVFWARNPQIYPLPLDKGMKHGVFRPRIRYNKTLLSPAKWRFDCRGISSKTFLQSFDHWAHEWDLPEKVLFTKGDRQLILNRSHPGCRKFLSSQVQKSLFLEFEEPFITSPFKSEQGSHLGEIVVPFQKNPLFRKESSFSPPPYQEIALQERFRFLGSDWFYLKIYLASSDAEKFLVDHLFPIGEYLSKTESSKGWFFIRYNDPDFHFRLRVHVGDFSLFAQKLSALEKVTQMWINQGLVKTVKIESYEREIERYGGGDVIEAAETLFCADTLATATLLESFFKKEIPLTLPILHAISLLIFLKELNLSHEEQLALLDTLSNDPSALEGFREHKTTLLELYRDIEEEKPHSFLNLNDQRKEATENLLNRLMGKEIQEKFSVLGSILHLHCNRLGCSLRDEQKAYKYAKQTLKLFGFSYLEQ